MWWHGPHMFGWWGMSGFGPLSILFWLLVAALVVAVVRSARRGAADGPPSGSRSAGLTILEERYAKGEIQRDEYLQKKGDLGA